MLKKFKVIFILAILLAMMPNLNQQTAYADNHPDLILYVHGEESNGGPIFHQKGDLAGQDIWFPGKKKSGVLRIYNNYSERIMVNHLSLSMKLEKIINNEATEISPQDLDEDEVNLYMLFAENMKLTIKKGTMLIFTNTIFQGTFKDMLYIKDDPNYQGEDLDVFNRFNINRNDYVDLEYTVEMDKGAGNKLQGLRSRVDFHINVSENPVSSNGGSNPDTPDSDPSTNQEADGIPIDIKDHWACDCMQMLLEKGIVIGYEDGTIRPENYISRAETAVLVGKALNLEENDKFFTGYIDPIPKWAKGYIIATSEKDIFKGYYGLLYKPNQNITREEITAVLMRAFELPVQQAELNFTDKDKIADWALQSIEQAVSHQIIEGYPDHSLSPQKEVTRAEAFTMICKLLSMNEEKK